jgi:hypothetical protein
VCVHVARENKTKQKQRENEVHGDGGEEQWSRWGGTSHPTNEPLPKCRGERKEEGNANREEKAELK